VPFRDNGLLDNRKKKFNKALSSARVAIERSFGLLKGRFRRLKFLDMRRVDLIPQVIIACCVLHNICIDCGDALFSEDMGVGEDEDEAVPTMVLQRNTNRVAGNMKRDAISNTL